MCHKYHILIFTSWCFCKTGGFSLYLKKHITVHLCVTWKKWCQVLLWECAGNGLLSVWRKLQESFFIHFTSKHRYLIWNAGRLSRTAGEDTPLFINMGCLTEMCCWKGEAEWKCMGGLVGGKTSVSPVSKADSGSPQYRWLLLYSEIVYVVWGAHFVAGIFRMFWLLWISTALPLKTMLRSGMNEDVTLWWCLFCISRVKWQLCWVDQKKGREKLWTSLCPAVKQWSSFNPWACWVSCELTQNRNVVDVWSLNVAVTKDCSLPESYIVIFIFTMPTEMGGFRLLKLVLINNCFL